jgi:hypothetical protein
VWAIFRLERYSFTVLALSFWTDVHQITYVLTVSMLRGKQKFCFTEISNFLKLAHPDE